MNIHEVAEKFGLSLTKLRRMEKAGVLVLSSSDDHRLAAPMRQNLSGNTPLSVMQLFALIEDPKLYAQLRKHQAAAREQVEALGDFKADVPPNWLAVTIRDASDKDPEAIKNLCNWLLQTVPSTGKPYGWIAVRALQKIRNEIAREELAAILVRALGICAKSDAYAAFVKEEKFGSRTRKIYCGNREVFHDL